MKNGSPSRVSRSMLFALVALLGLTVAVGTGSAIASLSGETVAVTAKKKKCKKGKKSAMAAKKKCKKHTVVPTTPSTPGPPPSTVRATLTWSGDADLDLYVWDQNGVISDVFGNTIANSQHSEDSNTGGSETFTDLLSPSSRKFSFGVCEFDDPTPSATTYTLSLLASNGTPSTFTNSDMTAPGNWHSFTEPGGYNPGDGSGWCSFAT
jgi:hypothetical protein